MTIKYSLNLIMCTTTARRLCAEGEWNAQTKQCRNGWVRKWLTMQTDSPQITPLGTYLIYALFCLRTHTQPTQRPNHKTKCAFIYMNMYKAPRPGVQARQGRQPASPCSCVLGCLATGINKSSALHGPTLCLRSLLPICTPFTCTTQKFAFPTLAGPLLIRFCRLHACFFAHTDIHIHIQDG